MNSQITDGKMKGDFPEVIEEYLEYGVMKCIAFNHRGTLLAAGCSDGSCVMWDFETRVIAKVLKDEDSTAAITSVCWSKYGHRILVSTADKTLILWDVATGGKIAKTTIGKPSLQVHLHSGSSAPFLCLASPIYSAPLIVDLNSGKSTVLPVSLLECGDGHAGLTQPKVANNSNSHIPACFNKHGDLVYLGNSKGEILIIDHHSIQVHAVVFANGGAGILNIEFSRNGMYLLTNSRDRTIRMYKNLLPLKDGLKALNQMAETFNHLGVIEKLEAIGTKSLVLSHELRDTVTRNHWRAPCFSRNGEWIIGGCASKELHKIYIWDATGCLVKILRGPKEALINLAWHPVHPIVVSLSWNGLVYIWAKDYTENWSAFDPDFKEVEVIEEYVEREDEFDIMPEIAPEARKVKESNFDHDVEADILTVENDSMFGDSEMSEDELCYLPSVPCPDTPEQQDKCTGSTQKFADGDCQTSAEAGKDLEAVNHELNLTEGIDDYATKAAARSKRPRKPTEKFLELLLDMPRTQEELGCRHIMHTG